MDNKISGHRRRGAAIIILDLLIALFSFWFCRYFGELPKWEWLVLSAIVWVIVSSITQKLHFSKYRKLKFAYGGIFFMNLFIGYFLFLIYRNFVPGYEYDYSILLAVCMISVLEFILYYVISYAVYSKIPFFYEDPLIESKVEEIRENKQEKLIENTDVNTIIHRVGTESKEGIRLDELINSGDSVIFDTNDPSVVLKRKAHRTTLVAINRPLNNIRHINTMFANSNTILEDGGFLVCKCTTASIRKSKFRKFAPAIISEVVVLFDYIIHRVCPKLPYIKKAYYIITRGVRRSITRVEVLGRAYRAGFEVVSEGIVGGEFYLVARKVAEPIRDDKPTGAILIRLKRTGKDGKTIGVYKFRTMHSYSEYLQPYLFKTGGLSEGGKFADDFRISTVGRFLRKVWLDELPMFLNWFKGDMKIIGVRPLSNHYFSLYSKETQELRMKVKPGLLPPFYADMPKTLEEIQESEIRYIKAYLEAPYRTDWKYFWKCVKNIVFKGKRSQ